MILLKKGDYIVDNNTYKIDIVNSSFMDNQVSGRLGGSTIYIAEIIQTNVINSIFSNNTNTMGTIYFSGCNFNIY